MIDINLLPNELVSKILSFVTCSPRLHRHLRLVCHQFKDLVTSASFRIEVARNQMPAILVTSGYSAVSSRQLFDMAAKQRQVDAAVKGLCTVDDCYAVRMAIEVGVILLNRIITPEAPTRFSRLALAEIFFRTHCTAYIKRCLRLTTTRMIRHKTKQWKTIELTQREKDYFHSELGDKYLTIAEVVRARALEAAILARDRSLDIPHLINSCGDVRDFTSEVWTHQFNLLTMLCRIQDNMHGITLVADSDALASNCLYIRGIQWRLMDHGHDTPIFPLPMLDKENVDFYNPDLLTSDVRRVFMNELELQMEADAYWTNLHSTDYAFQAEKASEELISALENWKVSEDWRPDLDPGSLNGDYIATWELNEEHQAYYPNWWVVRRW